MEQIHLPRAREDLSEVVKKYKDMVFGIALTHVRNKTDADDVSQEVFLAFVRKNLIYNGDEHLKAWLIKTTINCSKKLIGSSWRKKTIPLEEIENASFQFETALENTIYNELRSLPYKYRSVLHLFYFEDMSVDEISKMLNIKPGTVKVHLSRGRNLLKSKIANEDCDL